MAELLVRLRALLRRHTSEAELDEELHFHIERDTERLLASGLPTHDARRTARQAFGNTGYLKDQMRDSWGLGWWDRLRQDVRFGLRSFRSAPAFAFTVIGTIAIAIGLNTTVFTVFNDYVLRPVAVRDPYSLYQLGVAWYHGESNGFSWRQYQELQQVDGIGETFAFRPLFAHRDDEPFLGTLVTGNYFQALGGAAALGRVLLPEDAAVPGSGAVLVLSYQAWKSRFGADSTIVGRSITVRGEPLEIVGVAAATFGGVNAIAPDFWAPISMTGRLTDIVDAFGPRDRDVFRVIVRLAPGRSAPGTTALLGGWVRHAYAERPDSLRPERATLTSAAALVPLSAEIMVAVLPIFVAFGLVMLIACANVANVMLARGIARQREIGIRLALGAARARLIRQLLTEAVLLALPAAALGFLISRLTIGGATRLMLATVPAEFIAYMRFTPLEPDLRVFGFLLAAALGAALLFGLVPALQATRPDVVRASRGDFDAGGRTNRLRGMLVLAQVTICVLLLVCTGVLLRGAARAERADTGLETTGIVQFLIREPSRTGMLTRLQAAPGVTAMAATSHSPIDGELPWTRLAHPMPGATSWVAYNFVSPSYFGLFGVPIVAGRGFSDAEARNGTSVVIVSQAVANGLWPHRDPIGQTIDLTHDLPEGSALAPVRTAQVIGVARNTISGWVGTGLDRPVVYYPTTAEAAGTRLFVRVRGDATRARRELVRDLTTAVPDAIEESHSAGELLAVQIYPFRAFYWVSAAIGAVALLLTLTGIYGVLSYLVAQRTREIGIRMALGANARDVLAMVLGESARLALAGMVAGLTLAAGLSWGLSSQLYLIDALDPFGYALGAAVVLAACIAAAWMPSRRAVRVDPVVALRAD